jgi:hypothetical protein
VTNRIVRFILFPNWTPAFAGEGEKNKESEKERRLFRGPPRRKPKGW